MSYDHRDARRIEMLKAGWVVAVLSFDRASKTLRHIGYVYDPERAEEELQEWGKRLAAWCREPTLDSHDGT